jgi:hypothetical protein
VAVSGVKGRPKTEGICNDINVLRDNIDTM